MTQQIDAALKMIQSGMPISLGGGNHIKMLAKAIADSPLENVQICSPSEATVAYCRELGLTVDQTLTHTVFAFDGCDSADINLNVLKSGGAIFTYEKRNALLSDNFVILAGTNRYAESLDEKVPLTVELIDAAVPLVEAVCDKFNLEHQIREANNYMGYTRTRDGNLLIDCKASDWHEISAIDQALTALPGYLVHRYSPVWSPR